MSKKIFGIRKAILIFIFWILPKFALMETNTYGDIFNPDNSVCPGQLISKSISYLEILRNCSKIEGNLEIVLIEFTESFSEFDAYSFPRLKEITGFLILYRVNKLKSLSQLFPNLSLIRGETLIYNYALVIYEMQDLEEVGLLGLAKIMGGGVRIELNPRLCYIKTIQWFSLTNSEENIYFSKNKSPSNCIEMCPRDSNGSNLCAITEVVDNSKTSHQPRCWDAKHCQKFCPKECGNACYLIGGKYKCCHHQCLGGCRGPTNEECDACVHVFYNNTCLSECPKGTLKFQGRWCLTEKECKSGVTWFNDKRPLKVHEGQCLSQCPSGYISDPDGTGKCVECNGPCPKVCRSLTVESISSAMMAKGCTVIDGFLEIQIRGGNQVAQTLEENLGMIEEVHHYVKVFQAHSIISLRFLKNLKTIHGKRLYYNRYALVVLDNQNLQDIWDFKEHFNLTIGSDGELFFHSNRKLCLSKIENLVQSVGRNLLNISENDISRSSNGDNIPCKIRPLEVNISDVHARGAYLHWVRVNFSDERQILGYMVYYRKVLNEENVTMYSQRDACEADVWKYDFSKMNDNSASLHFLQNLEPFTEYVVYVQTYGISITKDMARSELLHFKTKSDSPSQPRDIIFSSKHPNELYIRWSPPLSPYGIVTHYYVHWQAITYAGKGLIDKNYCEERLFPLMLEEMTPVGNTSTAVPPAENCCSCPNDVDRDFNLESKSFERFHQINFQNHLQNAFYKKKSSIDQKRFKRYAKYPYHSDANVLNQTKESSESYFEVAIVHNRTEILLSNLRHYQEYNVEVIACQDQDGTTKLCSPRLFGMGMTMEKKSADDIDDSKISHVLNNITEVFINWFPPEQPNGEILLYEMELDDHVHEHKPIVCIPQKMYNLRKGYVVKGLTPGNWSYKIRTTSRAGVGSWTRNFYVVVPTKASHNVLKNVVAPIIVFLLALCIVCVLVYLYILRMRLRASKLRISNNPNYLLTEDVYTPDEWEVDRSKVTCLKELGSGSFGKVFEGVVRNLEGVPSTMKVAVKMTHSTATTRDVICFLNEASRMKVFKNGCNHVVKLYGVVSQGRPPYVIMELMSNGDLRDFLRSCRNDSHGNGMRSQPTLRDMLKMAAEIADGMAFLESKNYVHRDLASRNCLVSEDMVVKIADFGMTRDIYITDYYRKGSVGMLPVRWMPKESIEDGYFDHKSDVWSYGVVLWEIVTLGNQPYMGLTNEQVCQYIVNGGCLNQPEGCHPILADLMTDSWRRDPKARVSFADILLHLRPHLTEDFLKESFYFTTSINSMPHDHDDTTTSFIPLESMPSNEDPHDETALINNVAKPKQQLEPTTYNHRGLPMPLAIPSTRTMQDDYVLSQPMTRYPSGETNVSVITPDYVNATQPRHHQIASS